MCGRFTLRSSAKALAELFELPEPPSLFPRFNIAPSQPVAVVRVPSSGEGRVRIRQGIPSAEDRRRREHRTGRKAGRA
jgi:putative SOS response-associated peptidase YedK